MEEVDDLVLTPFKEIAEKARLAVVNAGDGNPIMLQAAQSLLKEGDRGLRKISPLCKKQYEDYGTSFIASLKDNDEIADYRSQLTDLLWEFDDYTEPADFDPAKFDELRLLSRKAAPKIYDIIMRMKLETPLSDTTSSRGSIGQIPTPTSPLYHSSNPALAHPGFRGSPNSSIADIHDVTSQMRGMMRSPSDNDSIRDQPPKPPLGNPWDWHSRPPGSRNSEDVDRNPRTYGEESPVLPMNSSGNNNPQQFAVVHPPPSDMASSIPSQAGFTSDDDDRRPSAAISPSSTEPERNLSIGSMHAHHNSTGSRPRNPKFSSFSIPENEVSQLSGSIPFFHPSPYTPAQQHQRQQSFPVSFSSESSGPMRPDLVSLPSTDSRFPSGASFGGIDAAANAFKQLPPVPPNGAAGPPPPGPPPPVPMPVDYLAQEDYGPIPVDSEPSLSGVSHSAAKTETAPAPAAAPPAAAGDQVEECKIASDSSFHLAKGFCEGAREVIRGGTGVKKMKKPGFATSASVARCINCLYECDFGDIETDVNREDKGTFSRSGVGFRVRFLQKSHIATKRVDDIQYGCVFCVHQGHTIDKSDATVFFNQKALFDHLARHPRPLPDVPGLTVIQGEQVPEKFHNDFDVHFKRPPLAHPVRDRSAEVSMLPSGVARDQARRMYGQRLLYDRSPALELAQGARITGLTWPSQYSGEWCFGWHEGNYASIPSDLVRLDQPPRSEIKYDKMSAIRATSRWKFSHNQKDKFKDKDRETEDWLKFDKNETISNIAYVHSNHWCWSGTNSKGKWGIFPQAYIDPASVKEPTSGSSAGRAGSVSEEKSRAAAGIMGKFSSMRKNTGRSPNVH